MAMKQLARLHQETVLTGKLARAEDELLTTLGAWLGRWRDPQGAWQRRLAAGLARHAGFSEANAREGLRLALADWDEAALRRLVGRELGPRPAEHRVGFGLTTLLCAGAIPMPTLLQILLSLLVRSPVLVKPASRDPVTAQWVADTLAEVDVGLAACVGVADADWRDPAALGALLRPLAEGGALAEAAGGSELMLNTYLNSLLN